MPKKELFESAFADAFENEWNSVEEVPFEPSENFKNRMAELMAKTNEENNVDKNTDNTESGDGNGPTVFRFGYIKRMLVAAAVMALISIVSVVTVAGTGEGYTFEITDTPYGLKIGSVAAETRSIYDPADDHPATNSDTDNAETDNGGKTPYGNASTDVEIDMSSDSELLQCADSDDTSVDCNMAPGSDRDVSVAADDDTDNTNKAAIEMIHRKFEPQLPDSYAKTYTFSNDDVYMAEYESPSGDLSYSQRIISVNDYAKDRTCKWDTTDVEIEGDIIEYMYFENESEQTIIWSRFGYSFMMTSERISSMEMIELSKDLLPVE